MQLPAFLQRVFRTSTIEILRKILWILLLIWAFACLAVDLGLHYGKPLANAIVAQPPGTFIGILGAFATVLAVLEGPKDRWGRAAALVVIFSLLYYEIFDVHREREAQDRQHKLIMDSFTYIQRLLIDYRLSAERLVQLPKLAPEPSLKRDAAELSNAILEFLVNQKVQPGYGQGGFGTGTYGGAPMDDERVMEAYQRHFQQRVVRVRNEFAKRGITDPELDDEYQNPVNSYSLRSITERLGVLSDRL